MSIITFLDLGFHRFIFISISMNETKSYTPEQRIKKLSFKNLKKIFLVIIALVTYSQLYKYVSESPEIIVFLENSKKDTSNYKTLISLKNGSESISSVDIIRPLKIDFNDTLIKLKSENSKIKAIYKLTGKSLSIDFDLLNRNEAFKFIIFSNRRPEINKIDYRIKNIEDIKFYDYEIKPTPASRILNIWLIFFILSILTGLDALLVVLKDEGLDRIKSFIFDFQLNTKNNEDFIIGYEKVYKTYTLRIKPSSKFMLEDIRDILKKFPQTNKREIDIIKYMVNWKIELFTLYRTRSAFLVISPIVCFISFIASLLNYFYFEINILQTIISITLINKLILTIILVFTLIAIIFPRKIMNLLLLKKDAKVKF